MKRIRRKYNPLQVGSAVFMILALVWLTISAPFVNASQQLKANNSTEKHGSSQSNNDEEACNPFSNSEEKTPTASSSFSEEFLHDHHISDHFFSIAPKVYNSENADTYVAYHGELLVPPPNVF